MSKTTTFEAWAVTHDVGWSGSLVLSKEDDSTMIFRSLELAQSCVASLARRHALNTTIMPVRVRVTVEVIEEGAGDAS